MVKIDFLNDFDKRMKFIARFSVLCSNSLIRKSGKIMVLKTEMYR